MTFLQNPEFMQSANLRIAAIGTLIRLFSDKPLEDNPFVIFVHTLLVSCIDLKNIVFNTFSSCTLKY